MLARFGPELAELEVRRDGLRVRLTRAATGGPAPASGDGATAPVAAPGGPPARPASGALTVNAPLTGVFYRSPSPQSPPFVQIGGTVAPGDVVGLIEAMKLFNEIRSTAAGRVREFLADTGQLVRAHQPIIELEP